MELNITDFVEGYYDLHDNFHYNNEDLVRDYYSSLNCLRKKGVETSEINESLDNFDKTIDLIVSKLN